MSMRTASRAIGIALLASALAAPAVATTVARLSLAQLVQRADIIVEGQVQSVDYRWDKARRLVFTYISIRVDDPLKGERRQSVLIRQIGGNVGTIQMFVAGLPQFKSGERALVFLKRQDATTFQVVGMSQGFYRIVQDSAASDTSGLDLVGVRAPLEQLKTRIRELL
jgi:hypothetical protein